MTPPTRWGAPETLLGTAVALATITTITTHNVLGGYLVVWMPLAAATLIGSIRRAGLPRWKWSTLRDHYRITITPLDVLIGVFVGLTLRIVAAASEHAVTGYVATPTLTDTSTTLLTILAVTLITPLVEETFFRGLALRATGSTIWGAALTSILFAGLHLASGYTPLAAVLTFGVGLTFAALTLRTGRLGSALIAHATYNGALLALGAGGGGEVVLGLG